MTHYMVVDALRQFTALVTHSQLTVFDASFKKTGLEVSMVFRQLRRP